MMNNKLCTNISFSLLSYEQFHKLQNVWLTFIAANREHNNNKQPQHIATKQQP